MNRPTILIVLVLVAFVATLARSVPATVPAQENTPTATHTRTVTPTITATYRPLFPHTPHSTVRPLFPTQEPTVTPQWSVVQNAYFATLPYPLAAMPEHFEVSEDGVKFVSFWEGYVGYLYDDGGKPGVGNCTIGYGHLIHLGPCDGRASEQSWMGGISHASALDLLQRELNHCGNYADKYVTVQVTQHQFDMIAGLICGWGYPKFSQSEVLQLLNQGNYVGTAERWKTTATGGIGIGANLPGLVRRRKVEADVFLLAPGGSAYKFIQQTLTPNQ